MTGLTLTIDGVRHDGWTSARVTRALDTISGGFALTVSERSPGDEAPRPVPPGAACTIDLDGETVITGYVDAVSVGYSSTRHEIGIRGRDRTGDLVDCSAALPGEWENERLEGVVAALAKPFGIPVRAIADTGDPFRKFAVEVGETVFEAIDRGCRLRAILPLADGKGGIELGQAVRSAAEVRLVRGENILGGRGIADWTGRFRDYEVLGQQPGGVQWGGQDETLHVGAKARDPAVARYRPLTIVAEQAIGPAEAPDRAAWEAAVRRGRARRIDYEVAGWRERDGGALWAPGRTVHVVDDWMGLDGEMLVVGVSQSISDAGTVTGLTVQPIDSYRLAPEPEPEDTGGVRWV